MTHETFKQAFFEEDKVAMAIGAQMDVAFESLVEQGIIQEFSSTWWKMCEVSWKAHQDKYYLG